MLKFTPLFLASLLTLSVDGFAQLICPKPVDLVKAKLEFFDKSRFEEASNNQTNHPQIIAFGSLEADDAVWGISLGIFDENRPRLQAKRLLQRAKPAKVVIDDEEGTEHCFYLNTEENGIPKYIVVTPEPNLTPCPSLQTMKDKPFTNVIELCRPGQDDCEDYQYMAAAEFADRGNKWLLISMSYNDPSTVISEAEILKNKAYDPFINLDNNWCTYFLGVVSKQAKLLLAIPNDNSDNQLKYAKTTLNRQLKQIKKMDKKWQGYKK